MYSSRASYPRLLVLPPHLRDSTAHPPPRRRIACPCRLCSRIPGNDGAARCVLCASRTPSSTSALPVRVPATVPVYTQLSRVFPASTATCSYSRPLCSTSRVPRVPQYRVPRLPPPATSTNRTSSKPTCRAPRTHSTVSRTEHPSSPSSTPSHCR
ncbi:hypothetical protein B0H12DRAFT_544230 [Mycena haematopus]|nr:hypothetical protein B0H12DRAFT_544230 [Mycena haematopus]